MPGHPVAVATLPTRHVLVFDGSGRVIEQMCGEFDAVKLTLFNELLAGGRFFWIDGTTDYLPTDHDGLDSTEWETGAAVTLIAIRCTAGDWLEGGTYGQPVGRVTIQVGPKERFVIEPKAVWQLIEKVMAADRRITT